jgi:hypothetical protein
VKRHSFPEVQPPPLRHARATLKAVSELWRSLERSTFSRSVDGPTEELIVALTQLQMKLFNLLEPPQLEEFVKDTELSSRLDRIQQAISDAEPFFVSPKQLEHAKDVAKSCAELKLSQRRVEKVHLSLQRHFLYTAVLRTGGELTFGRGTPRTERMAKEQKVLADDLERGKYFAKLVSLRDVLFSEVTADGMNAYLTHVSELVQDERFLEYHAKLNAPGFSEHFRQEREKLEPELEVAGLMGEIR